MLARQRDLAALISLKTRVAHSRPAPPRHRVMTLKKNCCVRMVSLQQTSRIAACAQHNVAARRRWVWAGRRMGWRITGDGDRRAASRLVRHRASAWWRNRRRRWRGHARLVGETAWTRHLMPGLVSVFFLLTGYTCEGRSGMAYWPHHLPAAACGGKSAASACTAAAARPAGLPDRASPYSGWLPLLLTFGYMTAVPPRYYVWLSSV